MKSSFEFNLNIDEQIFTSSYGLVRDWGIKKMNLDEQKFKRLDKQILNQPMHENIIPHFLNKFIKGQF